MTYPAPDQPYSYGFYELTQKWQHALSWLKFSKILLLAACSATAVQADSADYPELNDQGEFSLMGTLADHGWHDLQDERWNIYGQGTYIGSYQPSFPAAYTNLNGTPNSLLPNSAYGFTATVTIYAGFKAWKGAEFYYAPEMISELPFSGLKGVGGSIQNFELQKNGAESASWYTSRAIYRQTLSFGGTESHVNSGPMQLAGAVNSRRFVFTAGAFSILDIFDKNTYAGDLRHQFTNMAFLTNAAYDFAADARGYTTGLAGEFYYDDWAFRFARIAGPMDPNEMSRNLNILKYYGDQIELEHQHVIKDQPGAIRILGYRNREQSGSFADAIAAFQTDPNKNATTCPGFSYGSPNAAAPDLCWVRKANIKMGIGINMEQSITSDIGVFFRGMYSDGKTEVYSYTSADRSLSLGGIMKGTRWGRQKDSIGLGYAQSWISQSHVAYLSMGGIDGFIGDGAINYKPEQVVDIYYQWHVMKSVWLTADYQHLANPGYNADRGPVNFYNGRVHLEF
jgi:hypothetical protein